MNRLLLLLLLAPGVCSGKVNYEWTLQTENYEADVTKPLGYIPYESTSEMSRGRERVFGHFADAGYPLFTRMRNEQDATFWLQIRIMDHGSCAEYDGSLDSLSLLLRSGETIVMTQLLGSSISGLDSPTIPVLTLVTRGTSWDLMRCVGGSHNAWILFAGFPRVCDPRDILRPVLRKGVVPCAR